jgi:hypothetical protein
MTVLDGDVGSGEAVAAGPVCVALVEALDENVVALPQPTKVRATTRVARRSLRMLPPQETGQSKRPYTRGVWFEAKA